MSQFFELLIEKLTYGGDAMGRLDDGRAVFVPFGLPGERVRVRLTEEKKNFARGEIIEILESSKERIIPKCKHFFSPLPWGEGLGVRACGGCHYQNLSYERQLEIKTEILIDQLKRIGKIENPPVQSMIACPNPWNYRNHVQFHLTEDGKLGYFSPLPFALSGAAGRVDGVVPSYRDPAKSKRGEGRVMAITECHLPETSINHLWPQLEFEPDMNIERVSIRAGKDDDLILVLESNSPEPPELEIEAGISVAHVYDENTVVIAGNDHVFVRVLDRDFKVSAASFFQVNTVMAEMMVQHLLTCLPVSLSTTLLDIYCGVGLFSAFFAQRCERVIGIESSESACEDFVLNLDEFDNVELYEGTAEDVLPNLVGRIGNPPYVLVDPPRAGLDKQVIDGILKLNPQMIAYVSCDPSTLARDAARLINGGYRLKDVTPFDMFPQTYHIESISLFEK
ncbi:MAG: class I SAM-dependent RNA methyltransferase [Anaerolineae bacterium]|nr:class I SAM-dependent RNA methyltransferase [Anaerolineae bacterium]